MTDYKSMYFTLFNAVTTAIHQLQDAQQSGENSFIEEVETPPLIILNPDEGKSEKG